MTSPDGITWTSRTSAADNSWLSVAYGDGLFVAVSVDGTGNRVMTSGVIGLAARVAAAKATADAQATAAAKAQQDHDNALALGIIALGIGAVEQGLSTLTLTATKKVATSKTTVKSKKPVKKVVKKK